MNKETHFDKVIDKIDPGSYYTLNEIALHGFFPWTNAMPTVRRYLDRDMEEKNLLQPLQFGVGNGKRYRVRGENIIKYLRDIEHEQFA